MLVYHYFTGILKWFSRLCSDEGPVKIMIYIFCVTLIECMVQHFLKFFLFFVNPLIAKSMIPLCLCVLPYLAIHIYCNDLEYIIFVMKIILVICRYFSKRINWLSFKAFVRYFLSNLYFSPNGSPSKTTKNVFYFI